MLSAFPTFAAPGIASASKRASERRSALDLMYKALPSSGFDSRRAREVSGMEHALRSTSVAKGARRADMAPISLPASDQFDYISCADGSTWFYTAEFDIEEIPENEYYSRKVYRGYTFNIYNSKLELVGTVKDKVQIDEAAGETGIAQISLVPIVTKKFFNANNSFEVMVAWAINTVSNNNKYISQVYSLDGKTDAEGLTPRISQIEGIVSDFINVAKDAWSEDVYMTFVKDVFEFDNPEITEENASYVDYLNAYKMGFEIYKKAGYSSSPVKVLDKKIHLNRISGDGQYDLPFLSTRNGAGDVQFVFSQYAQDFYNDLNDPMNPSEDISMREGNELIIEIYGVKGNSATVSQTTRIPVVKNSASSDVLFTYYALGSMRYAQDVMFGDTPGTASFYITKKDYLISNDDSYKLTYAKYDAQGQLSSTLVENASTGMSLSDVRGCAEQFAALCVGDDTARFAIYDLENGMEVASIPMLVEMPTGDLEQITANFDRVARGESYRYALELRMPGLTADNEDIMRILWLDEVGNPLHIDEVNMGHNIAMAQCYIDGSALSPYIFNTDAEQEYMVLVKRHDPATSINTEELIIGQAASTAHPNGQTLLTVCPDDTKGALSGIYPIDFDKKPNLLVTYFNEETQKYGQEFYQLPLTKFAGGDGTVENPYRITSPAELSLIADNPEAHYVLDSDIDASDYAFNASTWADKSFSGTLDGRNHVIRHLNLEGTCGLFGSITQGTVKNLNIINATASVSKDNTGILAQSAIEATVENVHVYDLNVTGTKGSGATFGGLVATATNRSVISDCSVSAATIDLQGSDGFSYSGGIVGMIKTGTSIKNCSFSGRIANAFGIGGIVGEVCSGDETITDCRVDAEISGTNTLGGIAASLTKRASVARCCFSGAIIANEADKWGEGYKVGGIVGYLAPSFAVMPDDSGSTGTTTSTAPAVASCVIDGHVSNAYAPDALAAHNIVGWTSDDATPEIDWDNTTDENNPVYLPTVKETGIKSCYHIETPNGNQPSETKGTDIRTGIRTDIHGARLSDEAGDPDSRDGAMLLNRDANEEFYTSLGFKMGADSANPWHIKPYPNLPILWHQLAVDCISDKMLEAEVGKDFTVSFRISNHAHLSDEVIISNFSYNIGRKTMVKRSETPAVLKDDILTVAFTPLHVGESTMTFEIMGRTFERDLTVTRTNTGALVTEQAPKLTFTGSAILGKGDIKVYSLTGTFAAQATDHVDVSTLSPGLYIATCGESAIKFAVK